MKAKTTKSDFFKYLRPKIKLYSLICLLSVVFLSESVRAKTTLKESQIAQQPVTTQQDPTRAAAKKVFHEGIALYKQRTAVSLRQAIEKWQEALVLWQKAGDKKWEATTLLGIGTVYSDLGDNQSALKYYNSALPLIKQVGNKALEATTLTNIGKVYSDLGDNQSALKYYNSALPLSQQVDDKVQQAVTLNNIGSVYSDLGDNQSALKYYNSALPLSKQVGDKAKEATILNNIGGVYSDLGDKQSALKYYNDSLALRKQVGDKAGEATTLNNIGGVYSDLGDKQSALKYYNDSLALRKQVGDKAGEARTLTNIGKVYSDLGDNQSALKYLNSALPLIKQVGNKALEATTLTNIGLVYSNLGDKHSALKYYNSALPLRKQVGDKAGQARTLNNIGLVYSDLGDKQSALKYLNSALPLMKEVGDKAGEATTLNNIGKVYSDLGDNQSALKYYNSALPLRKQVGDKAGEATTLYNLAYLERDRSNLQAARTNIEAAIKIIEELRTKIDRQELRTSYFATQQDVYKFYIDLLMQLHKKDPSQGYAALGLHISERSRARSLIELLTEANAKILKGANPELVQQERNLLQQIDATQTLRQNLASSPNKNDFITKAAIKRHTTEIEDLLRQHQEVQAKIRTTSPEYAKLTNPNPEKDILKLPQIQQQLDKDTLLLQYSLGEEHSYLWAVTPTSMQVYTLPGQKEIEKVASRFREDSQQVTATDLAINSAKQLTQLILAPVADKLTGKRLVIVADGGLQTIPFGALADITSSKYQPLMINHEIINLPSASTIAIQRQKLANRQSAPKAIAILADPVYSATDCRFTSSEDCRETDKPQPPGPNLDIPQSERSALDRSARSLKRDGLDRLANTAEEAKGILKLIPAATSLEALNFDANYDWATSKTLNQFRILHFATHGFVNPEQPELSGIVLSLFDKKGKPIRGYLRLEDLFNQDYPAELIVLSACETGLGKNVNGEGLVGLTRGLMYAGAARVMLSLWEVNDEGTSILMQEFYTVLLQQKKTPSEALRAAQRKLWENPKWRSPYYWAGFTVQGEWR
ncbi:MAG: CHAT domain-containing protein [Brasilonema angustatum HA4187-MV1]|jgi:CHAT domain-containing protein/Tfp pilus assembly protein PilF|nr:CHAT domain-containing protein [Brasilonema angustatum HA4187-MV1]